MPLQIITADQRLSEANNKTTLAIFGPYGVGKTSLLHTLDSKTTLAIDIEGGFKSVQSWPGDVAPVRSWEDALDIACLVGGINPAVINDPYPTPFTAEHYAHVSKLYPSIEMQKYSTILADSITDLTRLAMTWARRNTPVSDKTGKEDTRGAYGSMGREVINLLKHMQHAPAKNIIFVGLMDEVKDEFGRTSWEPQMEGGKTGRELPGIVDEVISMCLFDYNDQEGWKHAPGSGAHRAFVCRMPNPWGLPAKDRSGNLDLIEKPHLGELMTKINQPARDTLSRLNFGETALFGAKTGA